MLGDAVSAYGPQNCVCGGRPCPVRCGWRLHRASAGSIGHYAAWRHLAADQPDLVLFLGDYIYEYATPKTTTDLVRTTACATPPRWPTTVTATPLHKSDPAPAAGPRHLPLGRDLGRP